MKAIEIFEILKHYSDTIRTETIDTLKAGDAGRETERVAFCHTITPNVLADAKNWGADLIITHEPTYYDNFDNYYDNVITRRKKEIVEGSGITVFRFHDHAHSARPDIIHAAFLQEIGLDADFDGKSILKLNAPMSAREMAMLISDKTGIKHPRLIGNIDAKTVNIALCLGACGDAVHNMVLSGSADMVICGEFCEWKSGEYFRDAMQMGLPYSLISIGHAASESCGMRLAAEMLKSDCPNLQIRYFECGDPIIFID